MAIKILERKQAQTLSMGKEDLMTLQGILVMMRTNIGRNRATLYTFRTENGVKKVWGVPSINEALLDETETKLVPGVLNSLVKIDVQEMEPIGDNGAVRAVCTVGVDTSVHSLKTDKKPGTPFAKLAKK